MWDINKKRGVTFEGCHMNAVKKVILWNEKQVLSAGIDHSVRMFDVRDWGGLSGERFNEDSETLNGYKFSKFFRGHQRGITQL